MEFCAEKGLCVGNTYFKQEFAIVHRGGKGSRWRGGKEHDRSGTGEESYAALYAGYEGSERNGMRPLRSCCTV